MEKFEVDGKTYIYHNGNYFDECFCKLCSSELTKVIKYRNNSIDYESMTENELLDFIKTHKDNEVYAIAKAAAEFCMEKFNKNKFLIKTVLPIFTSCCRKLNQPEEAIEKSKIYMMPITSSPALCTSLAAAYCDIRDYENAKKYAGVAYAQLASLPMEYKTEIANVYSRIKAESDIMK